MVTNYIDFFLKPATVIAFKTSDGGIWGSCVLDSADQDHLENRFPITEKQNSTFKVQIAVFDIHYLEKILKTLIIRF
jgi:hypothetical protein